MIFLTREGCHLCDDARPLVRAAARRAKWRVEEVDVDSDHQLRDTYGSRVPVVLGPGDVVLAEGVIDDQRGLLKAMRRSAGSSR